MRLLFPRRPVQIRRTAKSFVSRDEINFTTGASRRSRVRVVGLVVDDSFGFRTNIRKNIRRTRLLYIYIYIYVCVCVRFCFLKRIPTRSRVTTSRTHLKSFRVCARYKTRAVRCERFSGTRDVVLYYVSSATHTVPLSSFRFPNRAVVVRKS